MCGCGARAVMMVCLPHILILGAGPAGLGAAWKLAGRGFDVTVAERAAEAGGNSGSFLVEGQPVDYGSHRLHPSCSPEILADIRRILGSDLLDRPRHGRIRLCGRWLHFPLRASNLVRNAPLGFAAGVLGSALWKPAATGEETFAHTLERGLGRTICREFYFPYARKIWGVEPSQIDQEQARRRVSAGSIVKLLGKVLARSRKGRFFYPRQGFGQISEAYAGAAAAAGAKLLFNTAISRIEVENSKVTSVSAITPAGELQWRPQLILSTIPLPRLVQLISPEAPAPVRSAGAQLEYRAMILIYLVLDAERFTEYDAHYFPSEDIRITRLSEPKNYGLNGAQGRTVLCAELPCFKTDAVWTFSDDELGQLVLESLRRADIPFHGAVLRVLSRRLPEAYPIYRLGYRQHFDALDQWVGSMEGVVTLGRQGLFAHDNTHHTLAMAYAAADSVNEAGQFDRPLWAEARRRFESFTVED